MIQQPASPQWDEKRLLPLLEGQVEDKGVFPRRLWNEHGEEFRSIRTRVVSSFREEKHKCILVTSAVPREGKTTMAVNLARAMVQSSWRTLIIDADMRVPTVHTLFGLSLGPGLGEILRGLADAPSTIRRTDVDGLNIITAGDAGGAPAEIINTPAMTRLVSDSCSAYDYVVVDSPPLISITDTTLLSHYAHGIVMVVRSGDTPREAIKNALEQIKERPVIGMVLNGVTMQDRYYSYGRYYDQGKGTVPV